MQSSVTRLVRATLAVGLGAALAVGIAATAASAAPHRIGVLKSPNSVKANRTADHIDRIVVHTTEGGFWGSVRWLRNPRARGSSHFIVSQKGEVLQLVSTSEVAWHAGEKRTNRRSIGIEHEGWADRKGSITDAQYEASARLVAYLANRFGIPIDREHVIGHHEVPHPTDPKRQGGKNGHTDPGPFWRWEHYMDLIRQAAENLEPPVFYRAVEPKPAPKPKARPVRAMAMRVLASAPAPAAPAAPAAPRPVAERAVRCGFRPSIHSTTIYDGQTLAGLAPWRAHACGRRIYRVDFLIDGKLVWTSKRRPFVFAGGRPINTTKYANGSHLLTLRAYGPNGHRVRRNLRIKVANKPFRIETSGISPEQAVSGEARLNARPNAPVTRLTLRVGEELVEPTGDRLRRFRFDTTALANGRHELKLWAEAEDGRRAEKVVPVLVANPQEGAAPAPRIVWQSLSNLQTIDAPLPWHALVEGEIEQVEFWIDGRLRSTATEEPYAFGGDGALWDAVKGRPGPRQVVLRAIGRDGTVAESRKLVFVAER